ncbi:glycosyltransferase [Diplocloster hominis]|uniref:glycosyltransferase n=1 Tax=Diplocloster hominis TaxID=3079010 RepID=UPI0031B9C7AF
MEFRDKFSFSVLMSIYIKEKPNNLRECLDSILSQSVECDEIIIVEDGILTDDLYKVIDEYKRKFNKIRTYQFEENVMLGRALAKGVELCKYDLIARMDTDDICLPNRFEKQLKFLKDNPDITVVGGSIIEFDPNTNIELIKNMPTDYYTIKKYVKFRNPMNHMTVMFRKGEILAAGNYKHWPYLEDYYLWSRLIVRGEKLCNIAEPLVRVRVDNNLYKRRGGIKYFKTYLRLRREQFNIGLLDKKELVFSIFFTSIITLIPSNFRKVLYKKYLRK